MSIHLHQLSIRESAYPLQCTSELFSFENQIVGSMLIKLQPIKMGFFSPTLSFFQNCLASSHNLKLGPSMDMWALNTTQIKFFHHKI